MNTQAFGNALGLVSGPPSGQHPAAVQVLHLINLLFVCLFFK